MFNIIVYQVGPSLIVSSFLAKFSSAESVMSHRSLPGSIVGRSITARRAYHRSSCYQNIIKALSLRSYVCTARKRDFHIVKLLSCDHSWYIPDFSCVPNRFFPPRPFWLASWRDRRFSVERKSVTAEERRDNDVDSPTWTLPPRWTTRAPYTRIDLPTRGSPVKYLPRR